MSRQTSEGQGHEKLGANKFGVATQGIFVATITRLLKEIYVATSIKYVATQIKNKPREKVVIEKREATTREATNESKTHLFLIHFSNLLLQCNFLFLCRNIETLPNLYFAGFYRRIGKYRKDPEKYDQGS